MSDETDDRGRKLLQELSAKVREKIAPGGEQRLNVEGLKMVERLARDISSPQGGMPGIKLWRDAPSKLRLQRPPRNAEITLQWQRDIGAMELIGEKHGEARSLTRYVFEAEGNRWRRMEGEGELYEDMVAALVEILYPEGRADG